MKLREFMDLLDSGYNIWLIDENGWIFLATNDDEKIISGYGDCEIPNGGVSFDIDCKSTVKIRLKDYIAEEIQ